MAQVETKIRTVELKIGVVPFDDPRGNTTSATETSLANYLKAVEARYQSKKINLNITLVHGNYYQILRWMRDGVLDGAVVSSFTAYLLTTDDTLALLPVVEFRRGSSTPKVFATRGGRQIRNPVAALQRCLKTVHTSLADPKADIPCEFRMVSHLSTTGFVAPLAYIKEQIGKEPAVSAEQEPDFWARLLQKSRLELWHDKTTAEPKVATIPIAGQKTVIGFSYLPGPGHVDLQFKDPMPYVDDVLLVGCRRNRPAGTAGTMGTDIDRWIVPEGGCASGSRLLTAFEAPDALKFWREAGTVVPWSGYAGTAPWSQSNRDVFAKRIDRVFTPKDKKSPLGALYDRWYVRGEYAFTVDEVVDVLLFDQIIRRAQRAALVLPGGGVRATYQSVILDDLYRRRLVNAGKHHVPVPGGSCDDTNPGATENNRLVINGIAGTSGGALLGYLVSRRDTAGSNMLTENWIKDGVVQTEPLDIFPAVGVLRWLSLLVLVAVFAATSAVHFPHLRTMPAKQVPFWYTTFVSIVVAVAPFLIWRHARTDPTYYPYFEGLAFFVIVAVVHFIHSSSAPGAAIPGQKRPALAILSTVAGIGWSVALFKQKLPSEASDPERSLQVSAGWAFESAAALLLVVMGLSLLAAANGTRLHPARLRQYCQSLVVLFLLLGLSAFVFAVGLHTNHVTPLEMTLDYWLWVFLSALFAAKLIITTAWVYRGQAPLLSGIRFLTAPSGTVPFPYTPAVTLVLWGGLGIVIWLVFIAPALYTSRNGEEEFDRAIATGPQKELVPLIVSMTGLGDEIEGYKKPPYRGDYYAVNERWCGIEEPDTAMSAKLYRMRRDRFRKAVFASGSPFPIYPATRVEAETTEHPGLFVDGGYAHRVPIEAARLLGAAQILVVENISRTEADEPVKGFRAGALTANLANTFNLLFDRSQNVDEQRSRAAVVATIYPDWSPPDPFLMDFRQSMVHTLREEAKGDLEGHRVARIRSWGEPTDGGVR